MYVHTYIHTYIHTYVYIYIYIYIIHVVCGSAAQELIAQDAATKSQPVRAGEYSFEAAALTFM